MKKKAQTLTLNTVVIAVLVLVVLGILLFIAYKYIYGTGTSIGELAKCEARGKDAHCDGECEDDESEFFKMGGCEEYCCIPKDIT